MANWKKVIVSGSDAVLNSLAVATTGSNTSASVSIRFLPQSSSTFFVGYDPTSGSLFYASTGSFSATTASLALSTTGALVQNTGIIITDLSGSGTGSFNGSTSASIAISGAAQLSDRNVTAWDAIAGKFINTGLVLSGSATEPTASLLNSGSVHLSIQLTGVSSSLTGSFSGSFKGDGSGLTGVGGTLNLSGSLSTNTASINLATQTLTISGSATSISASVSSSASGSTVFLGFMPNVEMTNLTVTNDLIVQGTASFQNTENLLIRDRFVLLASGSTTTGDGGLIVQQGTQNVGELFAYDSGAQRWAVTSSFNAASGSFVPDAFMAAVVTASLSASLPNTPARYQAAGNIFIGTDDESIWIYS